MKNKIFCSIFNVNPKRGHGSGSIFMAAKSMALKRFSRKVDMHQQKPYAASK
ncbi:hypothetical protein [Butyrivibrio sp. JL13D10]|uniref:hypothetical protein n=1 Tax=Butyrivibrio sp. JL13D10 TaxID=3236815 RepID=UPI0038B4ECD2